MARKRKTRDKKPETLYADDSAISPPYLIGAYKMSHLIKSAQTNGMLPTSKPAPIAINKKHLEFGNQ